MGGEVRRGDFLTPLAIDVSFLDYPFLPLIELTVEDREWGRRYCCRSVKLDNAAVESLAHICGSVDRTSIIGRSIRSKQCHAPVFWFLYGKYVLLTNYVPSFLLVFWLTLFMEWLDISIDFETYFVFWDGSLSLHHQRPTNY